MCGITAVFDFSGNAAWRAGQSLFELQHRGELGAGVVGYNEDEHAVRWHRGMGLVTEVFNDEGILPSVFGFCRAAIGQTRYATTPEAQQRKPLNLQPMGGCFHNDPLDPFWLSHNGQIICCDGLKQEIERKGYCFKTTSDTEIIVGLLETSKEANFIDALRTELTKLTGSFSLTILYKDRVIAARDGNGIRPLCIGLGDGFFLVSSEDCAFKTLGARFVRNVKPGEIVVIDENGIAPEVIWHANPRLKICIFEYIYFARPDSTIDGQSVYMARVRLGETVAREHPVEADIVVPVPESGTPAGCGIARELRLPLEKAIVRNRYFPGRTFTKEREVDRRALQRRKFSVIRKAVHDKRVIVSEDTIVRGNVAPEVVAMLREEGAREVHLRVASSPIRHPCYFGIDMATYGELIAASLSVEDIRKFIQADSLGYTSLRGMIEAIGIPEENLSLGCFSGEYPVCPFKQ